MSEQYTRHGVVTTSDDLSVQIGYHFDWQIFERLSFDHNLKYYPSFGGLSDYLVWADAELRYALTDAIFGSFKAILDYDSTPGENIGTTDTKYILGVGVNF